MAFITEEILLAVPPHHHLAKRKSIQLSEVANEPFISLKTGNHFRELTNKFCEEAGSTPNISCEVDRLKAVCTTGDRRCFSDP